MHSWSYSRGYIHKLLRAHILQLLQDAAVFLPPANVALLLAREEGAQLAGRRGLETRRRRAADGLKHLLQAAGPRVGVVRATAPLEEGDDGDRQAGGKLMVREGGKRGEDERGGERERREEGRGGERERRREEGRGRGERRGGREEGSRGERRRDREERKKKSNTDSHTQYHHEL